MKNQPKNHRSGGRKKLPGDQLKTKKLQMHVTEQEFMKVQGLYQHSGKKTLSDFIKAMVLDEKKNKSIRNNVGLIRHLDGIGSELGRIGNNINQLAKYANIQILSGKMDRRTMDKFNAQMEQYLQERSELAKAYRAMVRNNY